MNLLIMTYRTIQATSAAELNRNRPVERPGSENWALSSSIHTYVGVGKTEPLRALVWEPRKELTHVSVSIPTIEILGTF